MYYRLVTGPSASPPAAVLTASMRGLREKWGFLHCGTYVVAYRDLPAPHLGWQLQPAREGEAALLRSGLFWLKVFSLLFSSLASVWNPVSLPAPHCSPVLLLAGLLCFRPPSIWVHQAGVWWSCPCRAGWGSETRGSSQRQLRSSRSHPCLRGSTQLPVGRSSHLVGEKWSDLIGGQVCNRIPLLEKAGGFCPITVPWHLSPKLDS